MHEVSSILQNKLLTKKCAILDEVGAFKTKSNRWVIRNVILKATWNSFSFLLFRGKARHIGIYFCKT